jgi:regulator of replication initiation timing
MTEKLSEKRLVEIEKLIEYALPNVKVKKVISELIEEIRRLKIENEKVRIMLAEEYNTAAQRTMNPLNEAKDEIIRLKEEKEKVRNMLIDEHGIFLD